MATMQSILDEARLDLNDSASTDSDRRNPDANLLKYANDALAKAFVLRPDLNYGNYGSTFADLTTASTFPLPLEYRPAVVNYVVHRCEGGDDQFVSDGRAALALKLYKEDLGVE
jgi:hypothetical protein